jgi:hypothetical protein
MKKNRPTEQRSKQQLRLKNKQLLRLITIIILMVMQMIIIIGNRIIILDLRIITPAGVLIGLGITGVYIRVIGILGFGDQSIIQVMVIILIIGIIGAIILDIHIILITMDITIPTIPIFQHAILVTKGVEVHGGIIVLRDQIHPEVQELYTTRDQVQVLVV